ncbi:hypothetical protein [Cerasicoccus fimbriatus]|uniref:hypothetical protein n=1 Tax=Cerasicoccus fimbriatus TaxID=3014554 RepID=UPI0022B2C3F2|nr:hypothetical protein [Cerasicoccus sp. TK19100]
MEKEEFDLGFVLDARKVVEKTLTIIAQHRSIDRADVKDSLLELIAVYYSKPFLGSDRAYEHDRGWKHKLDVERIGFTDSEKEIHKLVLEWRSGYVAHMDQSKRFQDVVIEKDEQGRKVGFQSLSSYDGQPLTSGHVDKVEVNLTRILGFLIAEMHSA